MFCREGHKNSKFIEKIEEQEGKEPGEANVRGRVTVASDPECKHLRDDGHPERHHEEDVGNTHLHCAVSVESLLQLTETS